MMKNKLEGPFLLAKKGIENRKNESKLVICHSYSRLQSIRRGRYLQLLKDVVFKLEYLLSTHSK